MRKTYQETPVKDERSVSLFKLIFLYQVLPSLFMFYLLWPKVYTLQLEGSLSKVDPKTEQLLNKQSNYYATAVTMLTDEAIAFSVSDICEALGCRVVTRKNTLDTASGQMESSHTLNLTINLDIYDIPIFLEAIRRIERTMILSSMEVHQYDRLAKVILVYKYYNPDIENVEWLNTMSLSKEHVGLLQEALKVHLWKDFIVAERERRSSEDIKLRLIRPELAQNLIRLNKQKGVLMYRPTKGYTLMPLVLE